MVTEKHYVSTSTLVDYLSYSAVKLLDVYAMLLKVKKDSKGRSPDLLRQINITKKQLDQMSYALILEYRKRQEHERFLKQVLISVSDQLFSLNNSFKETSRFLFQEIRTLQSQMQFFCEGGEKQRLLNDQESSCSTSKIDEVIKGLQKARKKFSFENPHLFRE
ncbi:hypothetical protein [Bartonella melophagi]|uniref:Uncharacterized protein n=1 Tax=Bartonella melophagi K-2C TaxID=1094557 RepID=J0ZN97_9HYPH|nr:hypothetical protein [Bartonella melophagi]EJF89968.1 hypothetical protein ME3_01018 [Bartonella melophagi K-2C]